MQSSNSLAKINLSENFPERSLTNLVKVFPQLKNIITKENISNTFSSHQPILVDKFIFYQTVLEKIKNYFELKENFVIADSISIIIKDLKDITQNSEKKKSNIRKKVQLPLINTMKSPDLKDNNLIESKNKTCRNYSTKSNGGKRINGPKSAKLNLNESFNYDEPNFGKINYVYLNLEKYEKPKLKIVKFADLDTDFETKRKLIKSATKKSNLKKSNIKKEMNKTLNVKLNDLSKERNKYKKNLIIKTKTEYQIKNKSNNIRLKEKSISKEKFISN